MNPVRPRSRGTRTLPHPNCRSASLIAHRRLLATFSNGPSKPQADRVFLLFFAAVRRSEPRRNALANADPGAAVSGNRPSNQPRRAVHRGIAREIARSQSTLVASPAMVGECRADRAWHPIGAERTPMIVPMFRPPRPRLQGTGNSSAFFPRQKGLDTRGCGLSESRSPRRRRPGDMSVQAGPERPRYARFIRVHLVRPEGVVG